MSDSDRIRFFFAKPSTSPLVRRSAWRVGCGCHSYRAKGLGKDMSHRWTVHDSVGRKGRSAEPRTTRSAMSPSASRLVPN